MSDDQPTYDQLVEASMVVIIEEASIGRAEDRLRASSKMDQTEIDDLLGDAQMRLVSNAPPEVRASFETVIAYHRWNAIYKAAMKKGQTTTAMDAQKNIDRLMQNIH